MSYVAFLYISHVPQVHTAHSIAWAQQFQKVITALTNSASNTFKSEVLFLDPSSKKWIKCALEVSTKRLRVLDERTGAVLFLREHAAIASVAVPPKDEPYVIEVSTTASYVTGNISATPSNVSSSNVLFFAVHVPADMEQWQKAFDAVLDAAKVSKGAWASCGDDVYSLLRRSGDAADTSAVGQPQGRGWR